MNTTARNGQSLLDIALQECGDAESAFDIAVLNGLSISDEIQNGQTVKISPVVNKTIVQQYKVNSVFPATAITAEQYTETIECEGIGFWGIEFDFIIS